MRVEPKQGDEGSDNRGLGFLISPGLDDYPLDPFEFRLYTHIVRRCGREGCFESIPNMARHCQMNEKTARKALATLIETNLLRQETRPGRSTIWSLTPDSQWMNPDELKALKEKPTPTKSGTTTPTKSGTTTPTKSGTTTPTKSGTTPLPDLVDEDITSKKKQLRKDLSPPTPLSAETEPERGGGFLKIEEEKTEVESASAYVQELARKIHPDSVKRQQEFMQRIGHIADDEVQGTFEYGMKKAKQGSLALNEPDCYVAAKFTKFHEEFLQTTQPRVVAARSLEPDLPPPRRWEDEPYFLAWAIECASCADPYEWVDSAPTERERQDRRDFNEYAFRTKIFLNRKYQRDSEKFIGEQDEASATYTHTDSQAA